MSHPDSLLLIADGLCTNRINSKPRLTLVRVSRHYSLPNLTFCLSGCFVYVQSKILYRFRGEAPKWRILLFSLVQWCTVAVKDFPLSWFWRHNKNAGCLSYHDLCKPSWVKLSWTSCNQCMSFRLPDLCLELETIVILCLYCSLFFLYICNAEAN